MDAEKMALQDKINHLRATNALLRAALVPLGAIADRYDDNGLDDTARKFWGANNEHQNDLDPKDIELFQGRGGKRLLTLADCFKARTALESHR